MGNGTRAPSPEMAQIVWTNSALADLQGIRDYIAQFNPTAARHMAARLIAAGNSLATLSERGRPAAQDNRELVAVWPYVIRYRIVGDEVVILRVRHGKRRPD